MRNDAERGNKMERAIENNLKKIQRKEEKLLQKNGGGLLKPLTDKVEEKIPDGLYEKLQQAFYLGFKLVFEKGNAIIEKTYDREQLELTHRVYDESFKQLSPKKGLKAPPPPAPGGRPPAAWRTAQYCSPESSGRGYRIPALLYTAQPA